MDAGAPPTTLSSGWIAAVVTTRRANDAHVDRKCIITNVYEYTNVVRTRLYATYGADAYDVGWA